MVNKIKNIFPLMWNFIKELGGISLFFAVITFWIVQHNQYISIVNSIYFETDANIKKLNIILSDQDRIWGYLMTFSSQVYEDNWNFISQYYSRDCLEYMRLAVLNEESMNTIITQRQAGNFTLGQTALYNGANNLKEELEYIGSHCSPSSWWYRVNYRK